VSFVLRDPPQGKQIEKGVTQDERNSLHSKLFQPDGAETITQVLFTKTPKVLVNSCMVSAAEMRR